MITEMKREEKFSDDIEKFFNEIEKEMYKLVKEYVNACIAGHRQKLPMIKRKISNRKEALQKYYGYEYSKEMQEKIEKLQRGEDL